MFRATLRRTAAAPLLLLALSLRSPRARAFPGAGASRGRAGPPLRATRPPPAVVVPPGTSPVEDQDATARPLDAACTVLVVGATRGLGLEFVRQCLRRGAAVVATHRAEVAPAALRELGAAHPGKLRTLRMDLASEASIAAAAAACGGPGIDALTHVVHSAGVYLPGASFDGAARGPRAAAPKVTKAEMLRTYEINAVAPLLVAQHFLPLLATPSGARYPVLAFLGSKVGSVDDNGSGGAYAYRASKGALNSVAKSLSVDLAGEARVVLLHPGYVRTDMTGGKGLVDAEESVAGMLRAVECTDADRGFRFVDYKACLIPW